MKIAKIFATGISGDIRSEFTVYNVKLVKTRRYIRRSLFRTRKNINSSRYEVA